MSHGSNALAFAVCLQLAQVNEDRARQLALLRGELEAQGASLQVAKDEVGGGSRGTSTALPFHNSQDRAELTSRSCWLRRECKMED